MNARIARTGVVLWGGFAAIVVMLTWWQVIEADVLREQELNQQTAWYEQRVKRGRILLAGGTVIADVKARTTPNGDTVYDRVYPNGTIAPHATGYSTSGASRTAVERTFNDVLTGSDRSLGSFLSRLEGDTAVEGSDVELTLDAAAQRTANDALLGQRGAIVALDVKTGAVRVMASSPGFDLNDARRGFNTLANNDAAALLNRTTQAGYQPGSTFKLITAAAALENDVATPETMFPGGCTYKTDGPDIQNFGGACVGAHTLTEALTKSINVTFADLGTQVGADDMRKQMEAFGFYQLPPLDDIPVGERRASGLRDVDGSLLPADADIDVARLAIGQERLEVTPLQMALVVQAIAANGTVRRPFLVRKITAPDGTVSRTEPADEFEAITPTTAQQLREMMENVVREGTGTAAALDGVDVGGKTGTADVFVDGQAYNQVWFVGFAPADNPRYVVAVTLERQPSGATGGVVAAPIARSIFSSLLRQP